MGKILKAKFQVNICGPLVLLLDEKVGFFQSFFGQPMSGRIIKGLLEIAFKSGQTSACQKSKAFQRNIKLKILAHERFDIYFFGCAEIENTLARPGSFSSKINSNSSLFRSANASSITASPL